ncbi:probable methyltransferase-like protein 15 homolog [Copidosoma floridanum]|uniref:probable methyltransferase-like protein 15 homolog n=1 Tax=Copidosoma floridanum TaxID=29053 RepID=UPI0006C9577A|nr:probable methyltransferase-like protein 15 homolog [Copidosoma floridanum]
MHCFKVFRYYAVPRRLYSTHSVGLAVDFKQFEDMSHAPVMVNETIKYLNLSPGNTIIDMTFGAGGHSKFILESVPNVKIFALDRDSVAMNFAEDLGKKYPGQIIPLLGKFSELPVLLKKHKVQQNSIDGILCDFGCSSMQFNTPERGFMISKDGPLDMRMDGNRCPEQPTAADVLERTTHRDLYNIIKYYGEEKRARKIARAIIDTRYLFRSLKTTHELAKFIESLFPGDAGVDQLGRFQHCATKTFQALRIFVNNELNEINQGVVLANKLLKIDGRLITISFHSLEDTIVKRHLSGNVTDSMANELPLRYRNYGKVWECKEDIMELTQSNWKMLHKHVLTPTDEEVSMNPRARSAKFRALVKVK